MPRRWLVKTEPSDFAFADLARKGRVTWDGVTNALAQIHLRAMAAGDAVLVYHTGKEKAVTGLARVAAAPRPDPTDAAGKRVVVDLEAVGPVRTPVALAAIRAEPRCRDLALVRLSRLSVMPVPDEAWSAIASAAGLPAKG
ncbi:MAG TPA: EVE domain-containing protein [Planctomycetota bacterium]|nr:EVE domain-containing protein [Planctomycetota bacterium]